MKRPVLVWVDDPRVTQVRYQLEDSGGVFRELGNGLVPVPPTYQATRDLQEAIEMVEMSGWSHRHELAARLRAWAGDGEAPS